MDLSFLYPPLKRALPLLLFFIYPSLVYSQDGYTEGYFWTLRGDYFGNTSKEVESHYRSIHAHSQFHYRSKTNEVCRTDIYLTTSGGRYASRNQPISRIPCSHSKTYGFSCQPLRPVKQVGAPSCSIGNPINIATGNKFQTETIFSSAAPLKLSYNSSDGQWSHSYDYNFIVTEDIALLTRPDGKGLTFTLENSQWTSDGDVFFRVNGLTGIGSTARWQIITPQGDTELFDDQGRLLSITTLQGETTTLTYHAKGDLIETGPFGDFNTLLQDTTVVSDHLGNTLHLENDDNGHLNKATLNNTISHIFNFDDEGRLLSRTDHADNIAKYHYENENFPYHLNGITGPDEVRFATWTYDSEGRAVSSEHDGQEKVLLAFKEDGSTTVTTPLSKQTTYHFQPSKA